MNMFQKIFSRETISPSANNPILKSRATLSVEPLEERQMLSINYLALSEGSVPAAGGTGTVDLNIDSEGEKPVMLGIVVGADNSDLNPSAVVVLDSTGNEIAPSQYHYSLDGTDTSVVVVKLTQGDYKIQVAGDDNSFGAFTCNVFMPGVEDPDIETGTGKVTEADALRALVAKDQDSGNFNANTIQYYAAWGAQIGLVKPFFDPAKSQYRDYFDLNSDGAVSPQEAYLVQFNADAGASYTITLNAAAEVSVDAEVTNWLVSDSTKTKTAVLEIDGSTSSNVTKLEAIFVDAEGAKTTATDITEYLENIAGGKTFSLDEEAILDIYGKTSGTLDPDTYKIKFIATTNDEELGSKEYTLTFTLVTHSTPEAQSATEKTFYAESEDAIIEWNMTELVDVAAGSPYSHTVLSVVDEGGNTITLTHDADPLPVKNASGTVVGYISYTDGTVGADGKYYNGKLVYHLTEDQVALSKGAADIPVELKFLVQDDSGTTDNKTTSNETIEITIHPVNKTPVVDVPDTAKEIFNPGDAAYTYKLTGSGSTTSAVIASDINKDDALSYNYDKMVVTVGSTTLTATGSSGTDRVWTTPQGTVVTLVWNASTSSYTELKVTPADADDELETEIITIKYTVLDDAGVTVAANGDKVSETVLQTLTITVNGVDVAPVITGSDLILARQEAVDGNISTGWTATGKDITTYKIGTSTSDLVNIAIGDTATVIGLGTFRLETNGSLTWLSVDEAMIPTDAATSSNFVFQATNAEGIGSGEFTITVNPASSYVFEDQDLYLSPNAQEISTGKVATGTALVSTGGEEVEYTIVSAKDSSGATVDVNLFVIDNGKIVVEKDSLGADNDLPYGNYTLVIAAEFDGKETITAEITLHIGEGTPAVAETQTINIGEKATSSQEAAANVSGLQGDDTWTIVENSAAIDVDIQVSAHGSTEAYEDELTTVEVNKLLSLITLTKDGNNVKCVFAPDTDYNAIFQFLSEGQTATVTLTYELLEEYYGIVSTGTFTIIVTGANDQPVGVGMDIDKGSLSVDSTDGIKIPVDDIFAYDKDLADTHFIVVPQSEILNGTADGELKPGSDPVTLLSGATLTYVVDAEDGDYILYLPNGDDESSILYSLPKGEIYEESFTLRISDDSGTGNARATETTIIDIELQGVNKSPYFIDANPIDKTVTEKTLPSSEDSFTINIYDIAADPNRVGTSGDTLSFGNFFEGEIALEGVVTETTVIYTLSDGSKIIISENGTILTFDPTGRDVNLREYKGDGDTDKGITWDSISVSFTVKDDKNEPNSESEAKKTLNVMIEGVNDDPVAEDVNQNVPESEAMDAWFAKTDTDKWVKINWRSDVYDPDIQETDLLAFTINGQPLTVGTTVEFEDAFFVLQMENEELVLRFRPTKDYSYLVAGETVELNYDLLVTDPCDVTAECDLNLTIVGETTTPNVGPGVQTFYLSTGDVFESFGSLHYYRDRDDTRVPIIDAENATGGTFKGFSVNSEGHIEIDETDPALAVDFADLEDGTILVYEVPFTFEGDDAGYIFVSIIKGVAPEDVDETEYTLTVTEKTDKQVDRPYDPKLNELYTIIGVDAPTSVVVTDPDNETDIVPLPEDLLEEVNYGINEDGRFWFMPGTMFHFLREGQIATIVFDINIVNQYGKPINGKAGEITVLVNGLNDAPVVVASTTTDTVYANTEDGVKVLVSELFNDVDVDDTHTIVVDEECLLNATGNAELAKNGDQVVLASGATLLYVADAGGDYLLYMPNGSASGIFYSLRSGLTLNDVVIFKVRDDSGTPTAESADGTMTFTVRGVNKTPVVNQDIQINVDADAIAGITVTANEISTDANEGDDRIFVSITYGEQVFSVAGSYEIRGEYQETPNQLLGTLVIPTGMASFTFIPNADLLAGESNGLEPYDPLNENSFKDLDFTFVIRDSSGIPAGHEHEEPAQAAPAEMKVQIRGAQGLKLRNPDFKDGSIHVDAESEYTLPASVFFNGKNVTFIDLDLPDDLENTFLKAEPQIVDGKLVLEYITAYEYSEALNFYPVELTVTVQDEEGETLTETIRIHVKEQFTTKVYIVPSTVPIEDTYESVRSNAAYYKGDFPYSFAGDSKDNPFEATVGEDYYLELWIQDNLNELLGFSEDDSKQTFGISAAHYNLILNGLGEDVVKYVMEGGALDIDFYTGAGLTETGTLIYDTANNQTVWQGLATGMRTSTEAGLGMPPKGWILCRIRVQATGEGTPNFSFNTYQNGIVRYKDPTTDMAVHISQVEMISPTIIHTAATPLTGLTVVEEEVNGGIYMRTVTSPTEVDANGGVSELPSDVDMLHEWQTHFVEIWVKASEADQYINAMVDLNYNTDYFTAVDVERGSVFQYGALPTVDDSLGLVSGIGGSSRGVVSQDGYILLGRVRFESIGTDNVPWAEATTPHSLGLSLSNGVVQQRDGHKTSKMGSGSKTELWANPYDSNDDGYISVLDYTRFTNEFGKANEDGTPVYSNFNVTRSGFVSVLDYTYFVTNFGTSREEVASGKKTLNLHSNYTNRYSGATLKADNTELVGAMLDAANQAWADALGLDKPITVQLGVKDFGDSTTLAEAMLLEVDENGLPSMGIITLDDDAAGLGWYSQIAEPVNASKYDLYTTLLHELGHLYGYNEAYLPFVEAKADYQGQVDSHGHSLDVDDVMYEGLNTGERKQLASMDVELLKAAYTIAIANPDMTFLISQTATRLEALGAKADLAGTPNLAGTPSDLAGTPSDLAVEETSVPETPTVDAPIAAVVPTTARTAAALVASQFSGSDVFETTVQLTAAVAQESSMPQVVDSAENARTLAELNTLGLDVALPQVNPTYSIASNVDQVVGDLFPSDDAELFEEEDSFNFTDGQPELLDQLIGEFF